jgi:hypothetical protein
MPTIDSHTQVSLALAVVQSAGWTCGSASGLRGVRHGQYAQFSEATTRREMLVPSRDVLLGTSP